MTDVERFDLRSASPADLRGDEVRAALADILPEAITEGGRIDFDKLKLALGEAVDVGKERYGLTWPGKADCFKTIQAPSMGTLRPCPEESVNWDSTENLIIEGDNLEVLKLLQKSYLGKVKMIYIDPPYNTGNDFIYPDNYTESLQTYLEYTGQVDAEGKKFSTNTDTAGRFHSKWLNMMYPRLYLARNLLRDDGVIFVSLDDTELANARRLCDEVFGEGNFLCLFVWKSKSGGANDSRFVAVDHEYLLAYARNADLLRILPDKGAQVTTSYNLEDENGLYALERLDKQSIRYSPSLDYEIIGPDGEKYRPAHADPANPNATWRWSQATVAERFGELVFKKGCVYTKNYKKDGTVPRSLLVDERFGRTRTGKTELAALMGLQVFDNPKPSKLIRFLAGICTGHDDTVVDFFAGSGSTAQAILELNQEDDADRNFILVQLPEPTDLVDYPTIADITKERVRRVVAKLGESSEGALPLEGGAKEEGGFRVFKLDESNFTTWDPTPPEDAEAMAEQLELHVDHVRDERTEEDLLYELLLKSGFPLTTPVERVPLAGTEIYSVVGGAMIICLSSRITQEQIDQIAALDPMPDRVVYLDEAFAGNDQLKVNAAETFRTKGITTFMTV